MKKLTVKMGGVLLLMSISFTTSSQPQEGQDSVETRNITAARAVIIAQAAAINCEGRGFPVTATVVDADGKDKAVYRSDGIGSYTVETAHRKAFTAASTKTRTSDLQARDTSGNLGEIDGFLLLGGGVPIQSGDATIGAVGVSGAPSGETDEQCAQAGIDQATAPEEQTKDNS